MENTNTTVLSHTLLSMGFLCLLGTHDRREGIIKLEEDTHIFASDNDTLQIWDEIGRPWMIYLPDWSGRDAELEQLKNQYCLKEWENGVCHSHDGDTYMVEMAPVMREVIKLQRVLV
jgi:hypothetical protein